MNKRKQETYNHLKVLFDCNVKMLNQYEEDLYKYDLLNEKEKVIATILKYDALCKVVGKYERQLLKYYMYC